MILQETREQDLPKLADCAREFYAASEFLRNFDLDRFVACWSRLLKSGSGIIFSLVDDSGAIAGTIGGVTYEDQYSGELVATEFFWFVRPGHRGQGIRLYRAFESWARDRGCAQIRMVHLMDSMPEKVATFYRRLGFKPAETLYIRDLT